MPPPRAAPIAPTSRPLNFGPNSPPAASNLLGHNRPPSAALPGAGVARAGSGATLTAGWTGAAAAAAAATAAAAAAAAAAAGR